MSALEALWLGLVQGLTEFFPVSSSGHLVLLKTLLGVEAEAGLLFEVIVHVATLVAIVLFYRQRIAALLAGAVRLDQDALRYAGKLALATLPAVIVGLLAKDFVESQFSSPHAVGVSLLVTGGIVWTTRRTAARAQQDQPGWTAALLIGVAQAFAILPGISRSGSTVAAALALGVAPKAAAEFSFLLGVIAVSGAALLIVPEISQASPQLVTSLAVGAAAALVSGFFAIWLFVRMLEHQTFHLFAWYAWAAGGGFLAWLALR